MKVQSIMCLSHVGRVRNMCIYYIHDIRGTEMPNTVAQSGLYGMLKADIGVEVDGSSRVVG